MLEGRLHKRLKASNIKSFKEYCEYLFSPEGKQQELIHMVDVVTTNKTDFFREAAHFDFLSNHLLPKRHKEFHTSNPFKVWSAGCSSGEEPYTLTMVLAEFVEKNPGFPYEILATDISTKVLTAAATAIYAEEKVQPVPLYLKKKYLLKSKDSKSQTVRIIPELRKKVSFERLNFIDGDVSAYPIFNVVFCRNVLIYFDRPTQEKVIQKLCSRLEPGGHLFLGHSESISQLNLPVQQVQPTVFRKI